jgi:murein DD-endopeptidase MepM/ murein hydrolase activator NlpD
MNTISCSLRMRSVLSGTASARFAALSMATVLFGCGAGAESDQHESPEPNAEVGTVAQAALPNCSSFTTTVASHVAGGRAYACGAPTCPCSIANFCAVGSDQPLPNVPSTSTVTVTRPHNTQPGWNVVTGGCQTPLRFQFPLSGVNSRDWVIQYYVDLALPGAAPRDYTGGNRTKAAHNGTDITIANFRRMDGGVSVRAAEAGTVDAVRRGDPDRNTSCEPNGNFVKIRHRTGVSTEYLHLKRFSIPSHFVKGTPIARGDFIGQVGSSGCSFWPHLHFGVNHFDGTVIDPFLESMWQSTPPYTAPMDVMDVALVQGGAGFDPKTIADPRANTPSMFYGETVYPVIYTGNGRAGDAYNLTVFGPSGNVLWSDTRTYDGTETHVVDNFWWFSWNGPGLHRLQTSVGGVAKSNIFFDIVGNAGVGYGANVTGRGWLQFVANNGIAGTIDEGRNLEQIQMFVGNTRATGICYDVFITSQGWQGERCSPLAAGTVGRSIQGIRMRLTGAPAGCSVRYAAHMPRVGWTQMAQDNGLAFTLGQPFDAFAAVLTPGCRL